MMFPLPPSGDPEVILVLREFREALEARDEALMDEMAGRWLAVMSGLDADIELLAREMLERKKTGEVITQEMLWLDERYARLKAEMKREIGKYSDDFAVKAISDAQRDAGTLGLAAADKALRASTSLSFQKLNPRAVETMVGLLGNGAPLQTLLKNSYPLAMDGLAEALINGVARGLPVKDIAQAMVDGSGMGLERAVLIGRSEMSRVYRMSSTMQYRESGVVSGFQRLVKKETACLACLFLDGEEFELESELDDHPAGKCTAVPKVIGTSGAHWENGKDWFEGLDPEIQEEKMGEEVYELWKEGAVKLDDIATKSHSEVWGDSPRVASLKELTP